MDRVEFSNRLQKEILLLDGSYGANLQNKRSDSRAVEMLNIDNPDSVLDLHKDYVRAGSNLILTNSFSANPLKLKMLGLDELFEPMNRFAVQIAKKAAQGKSWVFGDISSSGHFAQPFGEPSYEELEDCFSQQAMVLVDSGVDGILLETFTDIKELKAAISGARKIAPHIPLIASMTFTGEGRTVTGTPVQGFGVLMEDLDVDAIGINCTLDPQQMIPVVRSLLEVTAKPICVQPNAGNPVTIGKESRYNLTPNQFRLYMEDFLDLGVAIVGGCCGTGPNHIRELRLLLEIYHRGETKRLVRPRFFVTSRTHWISPTPFMVIGERINPASRNDFQKEVTEMEMRTVIHEAASQVQEGADVLDLNLGIEKGLTLDHIRKAICDLDRASCIPLSVDIQTHEFRETALREYPGRSIINSARITPKSLEFAVHCLKQYGGLIILLAMGKRVPDTALERFQLILDGIREMENAGISRDRILADPLVMTIGAGNNPKITLEAIRMLHEQGIRTTLGLSNLSYGMRNRSHINAAFLSQAISVGLDSAIMNPAEKIVMSVLDGSLTLQGKERENPSFGVDDPLISSLLHGDTQTANRLIQDRIETEHSLDVGQSVLGESLQTIGEMYANGILFLPHLLMAAQTAAPIFDHLNTLVGKRSRTIGRVLLATVEGDVHDIGKKIIGTVLQSGGFEVVDIGFDRSAQEILEAVLREKPDIVGLSAMMTTTIGKVEEFSHLRKEVHLSVPLICGGASLTGELAKSFECEGYCANASGVVKLCKQLLRKEADPFD